MAAIRSGRELPGRFSFVRTRTDAAALPALGVALAVVATRVPLGTHYLLNWDADQFALGISHFDLVHHQPHPPGYLGYIALGRLLQVFFHDPNSSLVALSIAAEAAGTALAYIWAYRLFGPSAGWITALALTVSPLFWYYGEAANTYALEPLLVLGVAWLAWRTWNREPAAAVPLGLALAVAGAIRPSTAVFMAPLAGLALVHLRDLKRAVAATLVAVMGTLCWLVPLLGLSGGLATFVQASTTLGSDVSTSTAIWSAGLGGLATTGDAVVRGTVWDLGGFAVVAVFGLLVAPRLAAATPVLPAGWGGFCAAWTLPALATFLFVHIGQVAYVQVFTPAVFLTLGPAVAATAAALRRPALVPAIAAAAVVASLAVFLLPPQVSLAGQLRRHDRWVDAMTATVRQFDQEHTVVVADGEAVGSYRTAQLYLPEYHRLGVGRDRLGDAGELFGDLYEPDHMARTGPLSVPAGTDTYVFVDRSVVEQLVADPERLRVIRLADGARIYVWVGERPQFRNGLLWMQPAPVERRGLSA